MARERGDINHESFTVFGLLEEMRRADPETYHHSNRVNRAALRLSLNLPTDLIPHFNPNQLELIKEYLQNATLHDIGKFAIAPTVAESLTILHHGPYADQSESDPTQSAKWSIRTHPLIGCLIIEKLAKLGVINEHDAQIAKNIAGMHHATVRTGSYPPDFDGTFGKFDRLKPEEKTAIGLISLIDIADAMLTPRSYRRALTRDQVEEELHKTISASRARLIDKTSDESQKLLIRQIIDTVSGVISQTGAIGRSYSHDSRSGNDLEILNYLASWVWENHGNTIINSCCKDYDSNHSR